MFIRKFLNTLLIVPLLLYPHLDPSTPPPSLDLRLHCLDNLRLWPDLCPRDRLRADKETWANVVQTLVVNINGGARPSQGSNKDGIAAKEKKLVE